MLEQELLPGRDPGRARRQRRRRRRRAPRRSGRQPAAGPVRPARAGTPDDSPPACDGRHDAWCAARSRSGGCRLAARIPPRRKKGRRRADLVRQDNLLSTRTTATRSSEIAVTRRATGPSDDKTPGGQGRLIDRPASSMPGDPPTSRLPRSDSPASIRDRRPNPACKPPGSGLTPRPTDRPPPRRGRAVGAASRVSARLFNGRRRLAALFLIPSLDPARHRRADRRARSRRPALAAWVISPQVLGTLLTLNCWSSPGGWWPSARRSSTPAGPARPAGWGSSACVVIAILVVAARTSPSSATGPSLGDTFDRDLHGRGPRRRRRSAAPRPGPVPARRRADQRPARRRRQARQADGEPDRHDDGRLARPGRPYACRWSRSRAT